MSKSESLSQELELIFVKLKKLLETMPSSPTEVEKEQLLHRCIMDMGLELSDSEKALLIASLKENINMGLKLSSEQREVHRPLSVPNEKYPCISVHSEDQVWQAFSKVRPAIVDVLDSDHTARMSKEEISELLEIHVKQFVSSFCLKLNEREIFLIHALIMDDIFGLGPIEQLMADPAVTDILANGYNNIYIERNGILRKSVVTFRDNEHLLHVIKRVVSKAGRRIDISTPYVDARLEDGSRINAIIPPLAVDAPSLSIRRFGQRKLMLNSMVKSCSMSLEMASFLSLIVRSKLNIIISGGTGSGKTTLLNAMSWAIDDNERIVTIEDSAELQLNQPHIIRLETRKPSTEGDGEVKEQQLVKNALRMRPDRIILGEVRGAEAFDMIQAMNTGHSGSMCTIHANNASEVASRLCNMVSMDHADHSEATTMQQLSQVLHVIVQISRMHDGKRRITNISEVTGRIIDGQIELNTLFEFEYDSASTNRNIVGKYIQKENNIPHRCLKEAVSSGLFDDMMDLFEMDKE